MFKKCSKMFRNGQNRQIKFPKMFKNGQNVQKRLKMVKMF